MRRLGLRLGAAVLMLGCSGRYEVGGMDTPTATPGGAGTSAGGSRSRGDDMTMMVMGLAGGSSVAPPIGDLGETCVPGGMPEPLDGPFASPDVVWARMAPWFSAQALVPPSPLPEATSYEWATSFVSEAHGAWDKPSLGYGSTFLLRLVRGEEPGEIDQAGRPRLDAEVMASLLDSEGLLLMSLLTTQVGSGRLGIFSQEPWLAAYPAISTRGYLMAEALFDQQVPPEPNGLNTDIPPSPDMTRREQLEQMIAAPSCSACHKFVDPLGISLEHFGSQGELRTTDAGRPIDSSGEYTLPTSGKPVHFEDHVSLGKQLVDSCDANLGIAARFVRIALELDGRSADDGELARQASVERVQQAFIRGGRTYRALLDGYLLSRAVLGP